MASLRAILVTICLHCLFSDMSCLVIRIQKQEYAESVDLKCITQYKVPITSCQFRIWYVGMQKEGDLINITKESEITSWSSNHPENKYIDEFFGGANNFNAGQCTLRLHYVAGAQLLVGCKLETETRGSAITTEPLYFHHAQVLTIPLQENHVELNVRPGDNVDIYLETKSASLNKCDSKLVNNDVVEIFYDEKHNNFITASGPSTKSRGIRSHNTSPADFSNDAILNNASNSPVVHRVAGHVNASIRPKRNAQSASNNVLAFSNRYTVYAPNNVDVTYVRLYYGWCGFTIHSVQEEDNGVFNVVGHGGGGLSLGIKAITLIVSKTQPPSLTMALRPSNVYYEVGDFVSATCTLRGVRNPDVTWLWWLNKPGGETTILAEQTNGHYIEGWSWPWQDAVISQSQTLTLRKEHDGLEFGCTVTDNRNPNIVSHSSKLIKFTVPATVAVRSSSTLAPTTSSSVSSTTIRAVGYTTLAAESTQGDDTNFIWLTIGLVAAFVVLTIVTIAVVIAFSKKKACFKDRDSEYLVQYSSQPQQGPDRTQIITAQSSQPKNTKPKQAKQNDPEPKKADSKKAGPAKAQPLRPPAPRPAAAQSTGAASAEHVQYADIKVKQPAAPARAPAPKPAAAQSTGAASAEHVQYADIKVKQPATPARVAATSTKKEEIVYSELHWSQ